MNKILTISIAAYNAEEFLEKCLQSLIIDEKTMKDYEVIVVDDGSTDRTTYIANLFVKRYPDTFRLISKQNGGWGSTINTSIKLAKGRYFKNLDADDCFMTQNIPMFINMLKVIDIDLVFTPMTKVNYEDNQIIEICDLALQMHIQYGETYDIFHNIPIEIHYCTFKTKKLKEGLVITENCYYTDIELLLKGIKDAEECLFLENIIYCYTLNRLGQSNNLEQMKLRYKEHLLIVKTLIQFYNENNKCRNKELINKRIETMIVHQILLYLYRGETEVERNELAEFDNYLIREKEFDYKHIEKRIDKRIIYRQIKNKLMSRNIEEQEVLAMRNWIWLKRKLQNDREFKCEMLIKTMKYGFLEYLNDILKCKK